MDTIHFIICFLLILCNLYFVVYFVKNEFLLDYRIKRLIKQMKSLVNKATFLIESNYVTPRIFTKEIRPILLKRRKLGHELNKLLTLDKLKEYEDEMSKIVLQKDIEIKLSEALYTSIVQNPNPEQYT